MAMSKILRKYVSVPVFQICVNHVLVKCHLLGALPLVVKRYWLLYLCRIGNRTFYQQKSMHFGFEINSNLGYILLLSLLCTNLQSDLNSTLIGLIFIEFHFMQLLSSGLECKIYYDLITNKHLDPERICPSPQQSYIMMIKLLT